MGAKERKIHFNMVQGEGCGFKLGTNIESVLIVQTTSVGSCLHCFQSWTKNVDDSDKSYHVTGLHFLKT